MDSNRFWIEDPIVLFDEKKIRNIWPMEGMSYNEKLNAISRIVILLTILGFMLTQKISIIITGIATLGVVVFLYYSKNKEGFINYPLLNNFYETPAYSSNLTMPNTTNPLMNVLLPEIQDDPSRPPAAPSSNPIVTEEINESTKEMIINNLEGVTDAREQLFNDLGDNFEFEQSMRQFYSTANTTIPNNQKEFADFCYGDMISCKEGNTVACARANPRHINY